MKKMRNKIVLRISQGIHNNITTREMDNLAASIAASMSTIHPDYGLLAARIAISSHQKETLESFSATVAQLYNNSYDGVSKPI
ncbi:MAG: Ribonucleoside-diphosphate reductase large subunit, partial [Paramarteilia canceri]